MIVFGLFKPRLPVTLREKVWTELRLAWLAEQFGIDRMLSATVATPTRQFFPEAYAGTLEDARILLNRVCRLMGVDATNIDFQVRAETEMPSAAGLYEPGTRPIISLEVSQLRDQEGAIATLAHEVAHDLLLRDNKMRGDETDHEQITDLLVAFVGMGVFAANTRVQQTSERYLNLESWSIRQLGYLTARVYGYSFAAMEWVRGDTDPTWAKYLGRDAWYAMRDGLRYLAKTDDTLFQERYFKKYNSERQIDEILIDLNDNSDSVSVAAMWSIEGMGDDSARAIDSLVGCLRSRSAEVKCEALLALAVIGDTAECALPDILEFCRSNDAACRSAAAKAIGNIRPSMGMLGPHKTTIEEELDTLIGDSSRNVRHAAVAALAPYGHEAQPLAQRLVPALETALVHCDYETINLYVDVLASILPRIEPFLRTKLAPRDPELYQLAADIIRERLGWDEFDRRKWTDSRDGKKDKNTSPLRPH